MSQTQTPVEPNPGPQVVAAPPPAAAAAAPPNPGVTPATGATPDAAKAAEARPVATAPAVSPNPNAAKTATEPHPSAAQAVGQDIARPPSDAATANQTVQDKTNRAFKIVEAQDLLNRLRDDILAGLNEVEVELGITQRWLGRDKPEQHLDQVKNGVNGLLEKIGRLRSRVGSTQT